MEFNKAFLYDWNGGNELMFRKINAIHGELYNEIMRLLSLIGDYRNFPYYIGALLLFALASFGMRKLRLRGGSRQLLISWLGVFLVLGSAYAADLYTVKYLKDHFSYPRPYVVIMPSEIHQIEQREPEDAYRSFPSGHAAFVTVMVVGMWPMLSSGFALLGVGAIIGVCWSRIALGVHFPADVVGGFLIGLFITGFLRSIIYGLLGRMFGFKFQ